MWLLGRLAPDHKIRSPSSADSRARRCERRMQRSYASFSSAWLPGSGWIDVSSSGRRQPKAVPSLATLERQVRRVPGDARHQRSRRRNGRRPAPRALQAAPIQLEPAPSADLWTGSYEALARMIQVGDASDSTHSRSLPTASTVCKSVDRACEAAQADDRAQVVHLRPSAPFCVGTIRGRQ